MSRFHFDTTARRVPRREICGYSPNADSGGAGTTPSRRNYSQALHVLGSGRQQDSAQGTWNAPFLRFLDKLDAVKKGGV